jgi:zinc transporter ZupT
MARDLVDGPFLIGVVGLLITTVLLFESSTDPTVTFTLGLFFGILLISSILGISPELPRHLTERKREKL